MAGANHSLTICQGATLDETATIQDDIGNPFDLTGFTGRMQIRNLFADETSSTALATAAVTISSPPTLGQVNYQLTATQTQAITLESGVWDLEIESDGTQAEYPSGYVLRLLQGTWILDKEATR